MGKAGCVHEGTAIRRHQVSTWEIAQWVTRLVYSSEDLGSRSGRVYLPL